MKKKGNIKHGKWDWIKNLSLKSWLMILLMGYWIYRIAVSAYERYRLEDEGICTIAVVYTIGFRFTRYYDFKVGQRYYRGSSISDGSKKIGDTLIVVYLPSDPSINRSQESLDVKCSQK